MNKGSFDGAAERPGRSLPGAQSGLSKCRGPGSPHVRSAEDPGPGAVGWGARSWGRRGRSSEHWAATAGLQALEGAGGLPSSGHQCPHWGCSSQDHLPRERLDSGVLGRLG